MSNLAKWIVVAGVIAIPVAYWFSANWLNNYADRTSLGWLVFVAPMMIQCLIVLM